MDEIEDLKTFIKVWILAIISISYCYLIPIRILNRIPRFLSLLPIIIFFIILPSSISAVHLAGPTIFYLTWLANFKLLLFAINRLPLASNPPLTFLVFISIALLPINPKKHKIFNPDLVPVAVEVSDPINPKKHKIYDPDRVPVAIPVPIRSHKSILSAIKGLILAPINPKKHKISDPDRVPVAIPVPIRSHKPILLAIKGLILGLIVVAYQFEEILHRNLILGFYCIHVYLGVELVMAITAFFVRFFLGFGFEIEPQFNEPYLATSLQDFWGRRWNLMVTSILRPTVYDPVRQISTAVVGKRWCWLPAIMATFVVSGLMHELIYYYLTRVRPTWEVTWFFVLHGVCTAVEVAVKKTAVVVNGGFRLHRAVSGLLTVAFVAVTGVWLFLPQILRNGVDVKAINEYSILVKYLRSKWD